MTNDILEVIAEMHNIDAMVRDKDITLMQKFADDRYQACAENLRDALAEIERLKGELREAKKK